MLSVKCHFVLRDSVGAGGIQIMVITPNLLCNAYLSNAHDWSDMPLLACPVAARRRDRFTCSDLRHMMQS